MLLVLATRSVQLEVPFGGNLYPVAGSNLLPTGAVGIPGARLVGSL